MEKQGYLSVVAQFLKKVALIDLGILVIVGLLHLILGWRTAYQFGEGLARVGMGAIGLSLVCVLGEWSLGRNVDYMYGGSVGLRTTYGRARQEIRDINQVLVFFLWMAVAGIISIGAGALIHTIVG